MICPVPIQAEARLVPVQTNAVNGIDFKNPFTMSNTTGIARQSPLLRAANRFSSSLGYVISVSHPRARQPRQSRALWARYAALADLGSVRISCR